MIQEATFSSSASRDISAVSLVAASLGFFGSLCIFVLHLWLPQLKNSYRGKLVVYLSLADMAATFSMMLQFLLYFAGVNRHSITCGILGLSLVFFTQSENLWISVMAVYMYLLIVRNVDLAKKEWILQAVCWGGAAVQSAFPIFHNGYGESGVWCTIRDPLDNLVFGYSFTWITFSIIFVLYFVIILHMQKSGANVQKLLTNEEWEKKKKKDMNLFKRLAAFPIIFLVQWTPPTINRIQNIIQPNNRIPALFGIHMTFQMTGGFLNALYWVFYHRKAIIQRFREQFGTPRAGETLLLIPGKNHFISVDDS